MITWIDPLPGILGTVLELDDFSDFPYLTPLSVLVENVGVNPTGTTFEVIDGIFPQGLEIDNSLKVIKGFIGELDNYYPAYQRPEGFSYDTPETAGGNYASYGSALFGGATCTFTVRATYEGEHADAAFSLIIRNNYSSDRDSFIIEYYSLEEQKQRGKLVDADGNQLSPEEFILYMKSKGFYL